MKDWTSFIKFNVAFGLGALCGVQVGLAGEGAAGPGNGGDPDAPSWYQMAGEVSEFLRTHPHILPSVRRDEFERAVGSTSVEFVRQASIRCASPIPGPAGETLYINGEACNYRDRNLIQVSRQGWTNSSRNRESKLRLVIHEYLGILATPDVGYTLSSLAAQAMSRAERSTFPLIGEGPSFDTATNGTPTESGWSCSGRGCVTAGPGPGGAVSLQVGVGGSLSLGEEPGASLTGSAGGSARFVGGMMMHPGELRGFGFPGAFSIGGDLRAALEASADRPLYRISGSANANLLPAVGVWIAVEANQFSRFREALARAGLSVATFHIQLGRENFILVRAGVGISGRATDIAGLNDCGDPQVSGALSGIIRYSRFFVEIGGSADAAIDQGMSGQSMRTGVRAALSIALGAIFPQDAIRLEGEHIRYDFYRAGMPSVVNTTIGLSYEARF